MILERTKNEIVIRLSSSINLTELQNMLDYLRFKEITSKSKATQAEADTLAESANKSMWKKIKAERKLK